MPNTQYVAPKKLNDYPNVREDIEAILAELESELTPDQVQDGLFVNFAFLAKCKGFGVTNADKQKGTAMVPPEFFLDFVGACYG